MTAQAASTLHISQDILDSARVTVEDLKTELAVSLYAQGRLSAGGVYDRLLMKKRDIGKKL